MGSFIKKVGQVGLVGLVIGGGHHPLIPDPYNCSVIGALSFDLRVTGMTFCL